MPGARTTVRRARRDDCAVLTRVAHAAKRHWGYPERMIRHWRADLTVTPDVLAEQEVFCAVRARRVIGFYGITGDGAVRELEHMWVAPRYMGSGVGRRLFTHLLRRLGAAGVRRLRIAADPNAVGFYRAMGGRRVGSVASRPSGRRLPLLMVRLAVLAVAVVLR